MNSLVDANYTDSEEDENDISPNVKTKDDEHHVDKAASHTPNSVSPRNSNAGSARSTPSKALRLVSYDVPEDADDHANTQNISYEENVAAPTDSDKNVEPVEMDLDTEDDANSQQGDSAGINDASGEAENQDTKKNDGRQKKLSISASVEAWTEGVKLPPEPPGTCSPALQESINKLYQRKKEGYNMNAMIQSKKSFRNPSIYEKLIQYCSIDEYGTNFPKELYDGHLFGEDSYYDVLAKEQKLDMERREKLAKERSAKSTNKGEKRPEDSAGGGGLAKRRSKWDQIGPPSVPANSYSQTAQNAVTSINTSGRPNLVGTSTISATAKTIPAFGNLKKH